MKNMKKGTAPYIQSHFYRLLVRMLYRTAIFMNENTVFVKKYRESEILPVNESEIWRYAGYLGKQTEINGELKKAFEEVKKEIQDIFTYKICYRRMNLLWEKGEPVLPFPSKSKSLARLLANCNEIILFSATIGLETDRYIAKQQRISPVKALIANAYGAERIENLCDTFCADIKNTVAKENLFITRRFSPGYGDFPLEAQSEIFNLLDCSRQIGVSLNDSLLMSPSKSVTALMGLKNEKCENKALKCGECSNKDCEFRKQENE